MPTFSEKLRRLMRTHGETTRSLGKAVDVTSAAVTGWMNGATPRPDVAKKLADYFDVQVQQLLDDDFDLKPSTEHLLSEPATAHAPGVSAQFALGDARAIAQQLRALADKLDPPSIGEKNLDEIVTRGQGAGRQGKRTA